MAKIDLSDIIVRDSNNNVSVELTVEAFRSILIEHLAENMVEEKLNSELQETVVSILSTKNEFTPKGDLVSEVAGKLGVKFSDVQRKIEEFIENNPTRFESKRGKNGGVALKA